MSYAPPQWSAGPAQVSITVPPQPGTPVLVSSSISNTQVPGVAASLSSATYAVNAFDYTVYVFDAVLAIEHSQALEKTKHPVQTGADISSHAYLMPATVSLEIGMSDAMAAYGGIGASGVQASSFPGGSSKSVNAFQTLLALQAARSLVTVTTRLRTYTNMLVVVPTAREDWRTITGLRCRVEFEQILTGSVSTSPVTARPDATQSSGLGTVDPTPVPGATEAQYDVMHVPLNTSVTNPLTTDSQVDSLMQYLRSNVNVNAAGDYSSVPYGQQGNPVMP